MNAEDVSAKALVLSLTKEIRQPDGETYTCHGSGMILNHIQSLAEENGSNRTIYIGDGGGDYCPSLKLGENDHVMPRKNFPLWKRIDSNPSLVKANVRGWSNGEELEAILLHLISASDGNHLTNASLEANLTTVVHGRPA